MTDQASRDGFGLARTRRTLPISLLRAREAVMENFRPLLARHEVTEQQWRVLRVLEELGETDASRLAKEACILAPSLSRIIKTLEARGLIAAHKDASDGRRTLVSLTPEGLEFLCKIAPESAAVYAEIEARIGQAQIDGLLDDLETLLAALGAEPAG